MNNFRGIFYSVGSLLNFLWNMFSYKFRIYWFVLLTIFKYILGNSVFAFLWLWSINWEPPGGHILTNGNDYVEGRRSCMYCHVRDT